ncbi:MAG: hypothetical protein ABWZ79_05875 [Pedobacter agri]
MEVYNRKKEQMAAPINRIVVADAQRELERKRSLSPMPRVLQSENVGKKLLYKSDIDELKLSIARDREALLEKVSAINQDVQNKFDELSAQIDRAVKSIESSKMEILKEALATSVKQQNSNVSQITDELVSHLTKLNELNSRLASVEDML